MARPPANSCPAGGCPVLLALHGAGVEASNSDWTGAYNRQANSWVLQPTGRTTWGYDWHGPSRLNVFNALNTLALSLPGVPASERDQVSANAAKIFMAGHSNGGQGCWYMTSHYPDLLLASNPAAGYLKIQLYVPYFWRNGLSHSDPVLRGVSSQLFLFRDSIPYLFFVLPRSAAFQLLESSISEYDTDLYVSNMVGIPLLARTGGADDNVPPIHSRRMVRLVNEYSRNPVAASLSEVKGEGHWFTGIMDDAEIQAFIDNYTDPNKGSRQALPAFPAQFTFSTLNPSSSGSKGSIAIQQLAIPYRMGRIHVQTGSSWVLTTENVRRFSFQADSRRTAASFTVDGEFFGTIQVSPMNYCRTDARWRLCTGDWVLQERSPATYGPIFQIYESPCLVVIGSRAGPVEAEAHLRMGLEIANTMYLYGRANVEILFDTDFPDIPASELYNLILLGGPQSNTVTESIKDNLPVQFSGSSFSIGSRTFSQADTGVLFLGPWKDKLALVIAGTTLGGTGLAMSILPVQTGNTIPDYVVVDSSVAWKGVGGALAAGYWTNSWDFDFVTGYLR